MQCHRNMDSSQKPLGPEKLSTLCRSLQSPDPRGAQSVCCSKRTDRVGHSWVQTVAQKNSRCPLTAFSSFSILYLMILHSRSGEFQWIPLQAADQGIHYRPRWLLEAWIPVFLRPASSSPCVFAIITEAWSNPREAITGKGWGFPQPLLAIMFPSAGCTVRWGTRDPMSSCFVFPSHPHLKKTRRAALDPHILTALAKTK